MWRIRNVFQDLAEFALQYKNCDIVIGPGLVPPGEEPCVSKVIPVLFGGLKTFNNLLLDATRAYTNVRLYDITRRLQGKSILVRIK